MPRVIQILNRVIVGGTLMQVTFLTHYMAPEFETLFVFGQKDPHEKDATHLVEKMGIPSTYLPEMQRSINLFRDYIAYKKLKQIIKNFKPDIVHTHAAKAGALGRWAAKACKVPVIIHTYHGHIFHSYFGSFKSLFYINIERHLAKKSDALIALSPSQKSELLNDFKIAPANKFRVIPLGLDLDQFQVDYDNKRKKFRDEFNLKEDEIAIGIIGRLVPVKNHELFLEAISYVLKNSSVSIKAFIVGDGETRQGLELKATSLNINYNSPGNNLYNAPLIFTSWRSDIDVINAGLDIVALTSFNEGTPVSLIEARAAHKPIVSTKVGGVQDVVMEGKTALLSEVYDKETFYKNLYMLVENAELRKKLSYNGEEIFKKYNYQRMIKETSELYNELLLRKE